jgi:F420-dependent oxidoreductase-like protein
MRIGLVIDERGRTLDGITEEARIATQAGLAALWLGQHYDWDPLVALTAVGREVPGLELATGIVPTYPLHPLALASQALSTQAATGNRLTLGVGLSHRQVIEARFGYSYDRPARHLREYLTALGAALRGEDVAYQGETLTARGSVTVGGARPPALLVAALGETTLRIAGELADGTITNWAGPGTLAGHVVPTITRAAIAPPRIVAMVMVCVTGDEAAVRGWVAEHFGLAGTLPSYRAMLDREGAHGVEDMVVAGDEHRVEAELRRQAEAGVTEFAVVPLGSAAERRRTIDLVAALQPVL